MPAARTHDLITVLSCAALTPLAYHAYLEHRQLDPNAALVCSLWLGGAHLLSGIMFSPDLDIDSAIDNRWGIFFWVWRPYMWLIPHRAFWSHSLVISPLLRLGYFAAVVYGLLLIVVWLLGQLGLTTLAYHRELAAWVQELVTAHPTEAWAFIIGFCTGSAAHTIADWLVTKGNWLLGGYGRRLRRRYRNHDQWLPRHERQRR
ncbi:metal-binding protein [uncultured Chloroflexus sp.]|uniref:metal-binding protein n=2 Tax=uncultured Chloroflexus sp. TaxID=214040 RepID=UPI00261B3187|nr:metal-binding protein [uncultured Chloroflexus sp.]